jgi:hypothetical protein
MTDRLLTLTLAPELEECKFDPRLCDAEPPHAGGAEVAGDPAADRQALYWEYLTTHPDQQALFDQAMMQRALVLSLACVPVLDWPTSGTIADIGGGTGTLLAAVLQATPGVHGILSRQPDGRPTAEVLTAARRAGQLD